MMKALRLCDARPQEGAPLPARTSEVSPAGHGLGGRRLRGRHRVVTLGAAIAERASTADVAAVAGCGYRSSQ